MKRSRHQIRVPAPSGLARLAGISTLLAAAVAGCGAAHHQPAGGVGQAQAAGAVTHDSKIVHRTPVAPRPRPPVIAAGAVIKTFTGKGDRALGSLAEKQAIVLQWQTSASSIQLLTAQGIMLVDAASPAGRVRLAHGDYSGLRVAAPGRWTVQLRLAH